MALRLIAKVMSWPEDDDEIATREYGWLRFMAAAKYDGYSDFRAGVRFLESLATWLKQFAPQDRQAAFDFIKTRLVYISPPELLCLIEAFVPETVTPDLRRVVGTELDVQPYEIWSTAAGNTLFNKRLRKTLLVGMSDGSRIDVLRRANPKRVSQEQVLPMLNVDDDKWKDLNQNLDEAYPGEKFDSVYLIDDFTASGTTFIREVEGKWKGKLAKFNRLVREARQKLKGDFPLVENYSLHIHHYISSHKARAALLERMEAAAKDWKERTFGDWRVTQGLLLPQDLELAKPKDAAALGLCDSYYDHALFKRLEVHCQQAGQSDMKLGYANCALPIVLDHNTPNNSIPLLWAETVRIPDHRGHGFHGKVGMVSTRWWARIPRQGGRPR
jgi:hypothetical protein